MTKQLKVGIVGASADRGWAKISHVPAIQQLAGLQLGAVVSGSQAKSDAAAKVFGAGAAYGNVEDLFRDPNIDIVSVCVKVPDHRELVLGALAAGKHVYCEWPLGRDLAESEELAGAAQAAGVHAAIGLQTRMNPAVHRGRKLIASGAIGRLLSARVVSTTAAFGPRVEEAMAFAEKSENGVTLVTIQGAHTLDLAIAVLGQLEDVSMLATIQYPGVEVGEPAIWRARSIPDHFFAQCRIASGGGLSVEVAGGRPPETATFRLEVTGEKGDLLLEGGAMRGVQTGRLRLSLNGNPEQVDEGEMNSLPEAAVNVAGMYAALHDDILTGSSTVPDFHHSVRLARLISDAMHSAQTGTRMWAAGWPIQ